MLAESKKVYKATTKGKFNEATAQGSALHFTRDKNWLNRANPFAMELESKFARKDMEMMERRKF